MNWGVIVTTSLFLLYDYMYYKDLAKAICSTNDSLAENNIWLLSELQRAHRVLKLICFYIVNTLL